MKTRRLLPKFLVAAGIAAVLLLAVAPLRAATPATGTLSESNPTVSLVRAVPRADGGPLRKRQRGHM